MHRASVLFLLGSFLLFHAPEDARTASTFTVTITSDGTDANPGDGACETAPGNGVCTLRAAVQETNALAGADTVIVPAGTYALTQLGADEDAAATGDLDILDDLTVNGAGASQTVIEGQAADRIFDIAPGTFGSPTPEADVTLSGMTIRNGRALGGGGVRYAFHLTMIDAVVRDNVSTFAGGGLASTNGISDDPRLTLMDSVVTANSAPFFGGDGGGIDASFSTSLMVVHSRIVRNRASSSGGGIAGSVVTEPIVLIEVTISGNTAGPGVSGIGGGVAGVCMIITRSTINGNSASANGGGIQNTGDCGSAITNSTVSGNVSGTKGGGIANSGSLAVTNVTVALNSGAADGGGVFQFGLGSSTVLQNTIVAGNGGGDCSVTGMPVTSAGNNIASDGTCGLVQPSDMPNTDPLLDPLADNGGPTFTHALLPGSAAIDAAADVGLTVDQRGVPRPQGAGFDIGAFERLAHRHQPHQPRPHGP